MASNTLIHKFKQTPNWVVVLLAVLLWRLALFAIGGFADSGIPYQPTFPYFDSILPETQLPRWLYSWANFDGVHYLTIVKQGYVGTGLIQAFFPLYPVLAMSVHALTEHPFWSLFIVNHLALFALAAMWWKWVSQVWGKNTAAWSLAIFFLLPTAFFLGTTYTESLFILLVITAFYCAHTKNWLLASLAVGLASATKIVGIALVPALLLEYWWYLKPREVTKQTVQTVMMIGVLGSLGLLSYMAYLGVTFGDPLYFYHVQSEFGAGRQEGLVILPQVFWRAIKIVMTYQAQDWRLWAYWQELLASGFALVGLVASAFWKKKSPGLLLFAAIAYLLPTLTGTFSSMPRYVMVCLPLWLWLGSLAESRRWLFGLFLIGSTIALVINTVLFIQGYWVA